jgi:hypothetical protein
MPLVTLLGPNAQAQDVARRMASTKAYPTVLAKLGVDWLVSEPCTF